MNNMNLEFNILWIDDDNEFYDNWSNHLKGMLLGRNLLTNIDYRKFINDREVREIKNKYDLILVDYNLSNDKYGTEIIKAIRHKALLPDIIFYSSAFSIESILEKEREESRTNLLSILQNGIYYSSAENLIDVFDKVVSKIVSREQKLNGFKGMVLSSVSEYEYITNSILESGLSIMNEEQMIKLKKYILSEIFDEQCKSLNKARFAFESGDLKASLELLLTHNNRMLDHYKRSRIMKKIMKDVFEYEFDLNSYNEMINLRNCLGHIPNNPDQSNKEIYIEMPNKTKIKFDDEFVSKTRKSIVMWNEAFDEMKELTLNKLF